MDPQFLSSDEELNEDSIVVRGLDPDYTYDFRVVAVDGEHQTPSEVLPVYTYSTLPASGAAALVSPAIGATSATVIVTVAVPRLSVALPSSIV